MQLSDARSADDLIDLAATMLRRGDAARLCEFDTFPAPLYATDADGRIVYFNPACVEFAGRTPAAGAEHWCVTSKLYSVDGGFIAHDESAMSIAVREGRVIRDVEACAEQPDGKRRRFRAHPTAVIDDDGRVIGGVNLLIPLDSDPSRMLLARAEKCRHLAKWVNDQPACDTLNHMAAECEGQAEVLRLH